MLVRDVDYLSVQVLMYQAASGCHRAIIDRWTWNCTSWTWYMIVYDCISFSRYHTRSYDVDVQGMGKSTE